MYREKSMEEKEEDEVREGYGREERDSLQMSEMFSEGKEDDGGCLRENDLLSLVTSFSRREENGDVFNWRTVGAFSYLSSVTTTVGLSAHDHSNTIGQSSSR